MRLYQSMYRASPKLEAQDQLSGRTHYVDDATLRFHHARILWCQESSCGQLFSLIESVALDMNNTRRGFRYVVFDVFGNVVSRVGLDETFKTAKQARKFLGNFLQTVDAEKITQDGIKQYKKNCDANLAYLEYQLKGIKS